MSTTDRPAAPDEAEAALRAALGRALRRRRGALGLTLRALQARTGLHFVQFSEAENGRKALRLDTLTRLAALLGWSPRDLLTAWLAELPAEETPR